MEKVKKILITGGSGTVGKQLTTDLQNMGFQVSHLSRSKSKSNGVKVYHWDIKKFEMDENAILENDVIIHLAGAGVFDKSWSRAYREEILESRVRSTLLINEYLQKTDKKLEAFISASAIGIYGSETSNRIFTEEGPFADGFLAEVVKQWENEVEKLHPFAERLVKLRIGIVLSKTGGALEQLALPIKLGFGAKLGSGEQWIPWIHVKDLSGIFIHSVLNHNIIGVYNAVSPYPVTNLELTKAIAKQLKRPLWLPFVPGYVLELILGKEKAAFVLGGSRISSHKIEIEGNYTFKYSNLKEALNDLL